MARYIDADKFIEWLDVGHLRSPSEICYSEGDVKVMIDMQPTADVAPKSEVDNLEYTLMGVMHSVDKVMYTRGARRLMRRAMVHRLICLSIEKIRSSIYVR